MKLLGKVLKDEIEIDKYLEERGAINPELIEKNLEVYKLASFGFSGGKNYEIWKYIAPSTKKQILCVLQKLVMLMWPILK